MGFWNALSVLAPVAPAMSDARDIRTDREQSAAKFASDQALQQAQLTAQKMAEQLTQQRIRAGNQPLYKPGSQPEYSSTLGTMAQPVWNDATQNYDLKPVPGDTPQEAEKYQLDSFNKNRAIAKSMMPPGTSDANLDYIASTVSGMKPPPAKGAYHALTGAAGQPRLGPDGKSYVRDMFDPSTNQIVEQPMPPDYKPPEPKPGTPRPGLSQGKNVFGFFNPGKKQWQDAAGNALPGFQPQPSFAETGLYEPMASYNPQTQAIAMGSFNRRTGGLSFSNGGGGSIPLPPAIAATIGKEFGTAREAQTRLKIMQQNAVQAYQGNQQAMVSLLMNHIGMTLGAQKGTRVAKSIIDEARQSTDWVDSKLATIGHQDANGDFIFDGLKGGITLTGEQIGQMVDLANQRNALQWQQVKDTGETYGVDLSGAIAQTQGAAPGGAANPSPNGTAGQFVVIDPRGKPHKFDTQAQADNFRGLIKPK